MRFQFYKNESRILDFVEFPSVLFVGDQSELEEYKDIVTKEYEDLIKISETLLKPFEEDIKLFYSKNTMEEYDFFSLITKSYQVHGFVSEEDYLNHLLSVDETDIRKKLIESIKSKDDDANKKENNTDQPEEVTFSKEYITELVNGLPIESGDKWNLFLIIDSPKKYIIKYVELLYKVLPEFRKLYLPYEDKILQYGTRLENLLGQKGEKALDEMTCSMIDDTMLPEGPVALYVSLINAYSLKIATYSSIPFMQWGLETEQSFQRLKEKRENKLNERILVFKNLGDKTRYEVLRLISNGETSIKTIANTLHVSSATISYHVNALITTNILKYDRNNNNKVGYKVGWDLIQEVFEGLRDDLKQE